MLLDAYASQYASMSAGQDELFEDDSFDKDAILAEAERRAEEAESAEDDEWEEVESWSATD